MHLEVNTFGQKKRRAKSDSGIASDPIANDGQRSWSIGSARMMAATA